MIVVVKRKQFGLISGVSKMWNKGALGKTAVIGSGALALGGTAAGIGAAKSTKEALTGEMGKEFSDTRHRLFSDDGGSGIGSKLLKGAGAVAAIGGGLMAGKKGFLGTGVQRSLNKGLLGVGTKMAKSGNKTIAGFGDKAIMSGAKDYGQAVGKEVAGKAMAGGASKVSAMRAGAMARTRATNAAESAAIGKL